MYFKKLSLTVLLLAVSFTSGFLLSCKKTPVGPEEMPPGRRDYQWTVDTLLDTPYNRINGLWGASENDIWCITGAGEVSKTLWHYDGNKWSRVRVSAFEPSCIFGFDSKNILAWAFWGEFWRYNGVSWSKIRDYTIENTSAFGIQMMAGDSPNNIYGVGTAFPKEGYNNKPVLMHYDGSTWNFIKSPEMTANFGDIVKDPQRNEIYLINALTLNTATGDSARIFTFNGSTFRQIYGGISNRDGWVDLAVMGSFVYVNIGRKIYRYQNDMLILVKDFSGTNYLGRIWGRNQNDFLCVTEDGIGHYNGTDLQTVYKNFLPGNAIVFPNQVFFYTYDYNTGNNIILKGILK